jgi:outer membrane autotransporter protein
MDFIFYNENDYTVTGNGSSMSVAPTNVFGYLQTFGTRMGTRWRHSNGWVFNPELMVGWVHDYGHGRIFTTGYYGGVPYTLIGPSRNQDRAHIGLGLNAEMSSRLSMFARYDGLLAACYNSQTLQAGLCIKF